MANICCVTKDLVRTNKTLSGFRPYTGNLSREDVATLVEVFEFVLSEVPVEAVTAVLRDSDGFFLFEVSDTSDGQFDFYAYINKSYTGTAIVSPVNAKMMFPRALSKGIFSKYAEYEPEPEDDDDEEPPTGYMDASDFENVEPAVQYYLLYARTQEEVPFTREGLKIGRSAKTADFITKVSINVSRPHCTIYLEGNTPMIKDERSVNGTFINGNRIAAQKGTIVEVGDKITLADEDFIVKSR